MLFGGIFVWSLGIRGEGGCCGKPCILAIFRLLIKTYARKINSDGEDISENLSFYKRFVPFDYQVIFF